MFKIIYDKLGFKTWFYFGQVLVLHYENLKSDMKSEIRKVLSFLRLPIDESRYDKLLHFNEYLNWDKIKTLNLLSNANYFNTSSF